MNILIVANHYASEGKCGTIKGRKANSGVSAPLFIANERISFVASSDHTTKRCSKCGAEYPATTEYFYSERRRPGGIRAECKACTYKRTKDWAESNPDKRLKITREYRKRNPNADRDYYERNKVTVLAKNKERAKANPEVNRRAVKRYSEKHPDHVLEWSKRNPHKAKTIKNRYRANKKNAAGGHSAAEVEALYIQQSGLCAYCGIRLFADYQHDHVVPLSRGGSDFIDNILLSCAACNQSKGNKTVQEWSETRGW